MKTRIKRALSLSAVLFAIFLFIGITNINAANLTVTPSAAGTDNLIGATGASWVFTATTTGELASGDVIKFIFPTISNGWPFDPSGVSLTATSGIYLYQMATGTVLSNKLNDSSFESFSDDYWNKSNPGSTALATSTDVAQNGSKSLKVTHNADGIDAVYPSITLTTSATTTFSYYGKGAAGGEVFTYFFAGSNPEACSDSWLYNRVSGSWACADVTAPGTTASTSPYMYTDSLTTSWQRITKTFKLDSYGPLLIPFIVTGVEGAYVGQTMYIDAMQAEVASSAATYNLGGIAGPTEGVVFGGQENYLTAYGFVTSTIANSTPFSVTLDGISNGRGQIANVTNLTWTVAGVTPADPNNPAGAASATKFTNTATKALARGGGAIVSDLNSLIDASNYATSATNVNYTFRFTATSSLPIGSKIYVNFPSEYSLVNATATTQNINTSTTPAKIANGAIATTTSSGINQVILTTSNAATAAGDVITVVVGGMTNPATAAVYRPFYVFTTKADGGLLDGSYTGFETTDYGTGTPPPVDTIHVGGDNTINILVTKLLADNTSESLTAGERAQVKISAGNPEKGFYAGSRWLDASGQAQYKNLLDGSYMIGTEPFNKGDNTFYNTFLVPAMKSISAIDGVTVTTTLVFAVPDASSTIAITGGVSGQNAFINAYSDSYQSFSPVFTDTSYTTEGFDGSGNGYAKLSLKSGQNWNFNVMGGSYGSSANFSNDGTKYWPPTIPSAFIKSGTQSLGTFAYIPANKTLTVTLKKSGSEEAITNACVGVKAGGGQFFMGSQDEICTPNSGNNYQFKVPSGSVTVTVGRPGFGQPAEYPVAINADTVTKTLYLSSPTSYISVSVVDSSGTAINGAPVFAHGSNGFSQGMTNSAGTSTIYVSAGTYTVEGFAPGLGPLTAQSATVTNSSNPSITFTVNTGNLRTITGRVLLGGSGLAGVKIGARGTGNTTGGNGTETDSSGNFTLRVPSGTYEVGGWSPDTGGLTPVSANASAGNVTLADWSLGAQGTLRIHVKNSSNISPMFGGAFSPSTGRGNGTESWTASSTVATAKYADIKLPAGTYEVHVGSPITGEITPANSQAVITGGAITNVTYDAATTASLITVSGTVKKDGSGVSNANVWISGIGNPMFLSTQTDTNGAFSLKVPENRNYRIGSKVLGYVTNEGDLSISATSTTYTQNFTLATASSAISGTVTNASGSAVANGWVSAKKTVSGNDIWTGTPTDDSGNYSLAVDDATWTVYAEGPCYFRSSGLSTVAGTGKNITLTANASCTVPTPQIQGVTDSTGGQVAKNSTILDIPANALGTANSTVSVSISDPNLVVSSANATPMKNAVQSITATDSTGASITTLNSDASLSISYDPNDLPIGFNEANLQLGYFDTNTGQWESVAATVDTVNNKITANVSHFTDYGPILPGVPDQPTNLAASAASASQINLTWDSLPTATEYVIYRNTTGATTFTSSDFLASSTAASYSDTGLTASTAYYYEVAGYNSNGEGTNSDTANATTSAAPVTSSGGGSGSIAPTNIPPVLGVTPITAVGGTTVAGNTVNLQFSVTSANEMILSENSTFSGVSWTPYKATTAFTLSSGLGDKTVYVKFRSADGSTTDTKSITLSVVTASQLPAPATVSTPGGAAIVTTTVNPESKIVISGTIPAGYQPGTKLQFNYQYRNETAKSVSIKVTRQLINAKGKVIKTSTASKLLKPGISFNGYVSDTLAKTLAPGDYTVKIIIKDKTGKLLDQNSFVITVEKLKKKYFILPTEVPAANDISFDEATWSKIRSNVLLPATLRLRYAYTNNSGTYHVCRMIRELIGPDGKLVERKTGKWHMDPAEKFSQNFVQAINSKLNPGNYTIRIRAYDWTTNELLAENSLGFTVDFK